jgi:hypothetical protein
MIRIRHALILASALATGACAESTPTSMHSHEQALMGMNAAAAPMSDFLKQVRRETSRFHSTEQAIRAGYVPTDHCVASPAGGMGMHWGNRGLIDPVFDPMRPEVVLYEPRPNGQPKLVAVEYVVIDVGQPHPEFDGHPFDIGGSPVVNGPHWTLHVWLHQDNPNGIYTPFNPTVTCN